MMNKKYPSEIVAEAYKQLEEEKHKRLVEEAKDALRLRKNRPWYQRLFGFKITIERI